MKCRACGHEFDVELPFSMHDKGETPTCPRCDGEAEVVITGGAGFVLRGGGWYSDGYSHERKK